MKSGVRATSTLRSVVPVDAGDAGGIPEEPGEGIASIVVPPRAWAVGRPLAEMRARGAEVAFTALRRKGITGREPADSTVLREGDVIVVYGMPDAIEHAETIVLTGLRLAALRNFRSALLIEWPSCANTD